MSSSDDHKVGSDGSGSSVGVGVGVSPMLGCQLDISALHSKWSSLAGNKNVHMKSPSSDDAVPGPHQDPAGETHTGTCEQHIAKCVPVAGYFWTSIVVV